MKELKNFIKVSQKLLNEYIEKRTQDEIEDNHDEYFLGTDDYGYYNNGVGFACCGGIENIYDEKKAKEKVLEDIDLDDLYCELTSNKEFAKAFKALLEAL